MAGGAPPRRILSYPWMMLFAQQVHRIENKTKELNRTWNLITILKMIFHNTSSSSPLMSNALWHGSRLFGSTRHFLQARSLLSKLSDQAIFLSNTTTKIYSQKLLKLEELAGVPVKATPHWSLNTSKVVVRCAELKKCSQDEILENLETQGVIDHYNISVRSDDGQRKKQIHTLSHSTVPHHQKK